MKILRPVSEARGRGAACIVAILTGLVVPAVIAVTSAGAMDLKVRDIVAKLFHANPNNPVNLNNANVSGFDLSGVNFKAAHLRNSQFFGTNLSNSDLRGTDLAGATLNRAVVIRANFSGANLENSSIMRPTVFSDLNLNRAEAPNFSGANLTSARITGNLDGANFRGANLTGLDFQPHEPRADISFFPRNFCRGCDFTRATLKNSNLYDASFVMAKFVNADLSGANLMRVDLTKADLTGADLTGADLTDANLDSAILLNVRGIDRVKGLP